MNTLYIEAFYKEELDSDLRQVVAVIRMPHNTGIYSMLIAYEHCLLPQLWMGAEITAIIGSNSRYGDSKLHEKLC